MAKKIKITLYPDEIPKKFTKKEGGNKRHHRLDDDGDYCIAEVESGTFFCIHTKGIDQIEISGEE